ncbi:MAG: hypothetical protein IPH62_10755 [Ignavibacteriae bacterium]|nr:hypothetical protein [Ignavibacteriota bacterium]
MKNFSKLFLIVLTLLFTTVSFGFTKEKYNQIEDNLIVGINTDNRGLQVSCAFFLGELKSEKAVIPLLRMLKSGITEEERIIAALSLSKIKSEQGMYAVKQRIKFDDSERVQKLCAKFYNCFLANQRKPQVIVEPFEVVNLNLEYNGVKLADFVK